MGISPRTVASHESGCSGALKSRLLLARLGCVEQSCDMPLRDSCSSLAGMALHRTQKLNLLRLLVLLTVVLAAIKYFFRDR